MNCCVFLLCIDWGTQLLLDVFSQQSSKATFACSCVYGSQTSQLHSAVPIMVRRPVRVVVRFQCAVWERLPIVHFMFKDLWGYFLISKIKDLVHFCRADIRRGNQCFQLLFHSLFTLVICCRFEMLCLDWQSEALLQLSWDCGSCLKIVSLAGLSGIYYIELQTLNQQNYCNAPAKLVAGSMH